MHEILIIMHSTSSRRSRTPGSQLGQGGIVLLEALCALLIFAVGVLGLVGLQATSVKQAAAAEYRSTAVLQANDLISRMWISDRSIANWNAQFADSPAGAGYTAWKNAWTAALPGTEIAGNAPTVKFEAVPGGISGTPGTSRATIVIQWKAPSDDKVHQYTVVAQLDQPQK
ncbi:UNVERIFIED_ORG: type IV pilus assembly protein PilV [Variovorax paradoxus]|nr:type IV pilus assembly protein PilV [Variovorax paradoxus]